MNRKTAAVLTISDKGFQGTRTDTSGPMLCRLLEQEGYQVVHTLILPDEEDRIQKELMSCADERKVDLVLTTGGTGFSMRDRTPEATLAVVDRIVPGIPEAMRSESMKITPRGCLSRSAAGIRNRTLIINLPGSDKAARENIEAVLPAVGHGLDILSTEGSADCASDFTEGKEVPSMEAWRQEAKACEHGDKIGMILWHNGIVRSTRKTLVREGKPGKAVTGMEITVDREKAEMALEETKKREGIYYVRLWIAEGLLSVGDDIMFVMIGGDIRPRVISALEFLVEKIKTECLTETEITE